MNHRDGARPLLAVTPSGDVSVGCSDPGDLPETAMGGTLDEEDRGSVTDAAVVL